jgi:hypothetical protein
MTLTITAPGKSLGFALDIDGNTFGCAPPSPEATTIPAGTGANGWSATGFKLSKVSPGFGTMTVAYGYPSGKLVATGKAPNCAPGVSWTINGTMKGSSLDGTMTITLPTGTATTVIHLTKG